jgi:hypothetical protein
MMGLIPRWIFYPYFPSAYIGEDEMITIITKFFWAPLGLIALLLL